MTKIIFNLFLICLTLFVISCEDEKTATLVLLNGKIISVNNNFDIFEAVVCTDDKITFIGSSAEAKKFISENTRVINLKGKTVLPGLIDAQGHMHELGSQLTYLNVSNTESFDEIVEIVKNRVKEIEPGEWILGGRWDQNNWKNTEFPTHELLSTVSPDNPVFLERVDGYAALVNRRAMHIAGIDKNTQTPFGGNIIKNNRGEPTGVLINRAVNLVKNIIPGETDSSFKEKVLRGIDNCLKSGLTSWHEIGASPYEIELYKELVDEGKLKLRSVIFIGKKEDQPIEGDPEKYFLRFKTENYGNYNLAVKGIQLHFDGSVGSRGAALFEPYEDDPLNIGLLRIPPEYIYRVALAGLKMKMIVNTSCIGTRANNLCLNNYERAFREAPVTDHRFRITHAQILLESDITRFTKLNVIPSMQPIHATSDKRFVEKRLGKKRMAGAYAWRSILNTGSIIACGSDFPVESNNPFKGIYAAITRQDEEGNPPDGWYPEQCMTLEEAIRGYTIWAAQSVFQENILGSIEMGKLADFTIIDRDILSINPENIPETKVIFTIIGGKIVFENNEY